MRRLTKLFKYLQHLKFKYLFSGSIVVVYGKGAIGKNVKIKNSKVIVHELSTLVIGDDCSLS